MSSLAERYLREFLKEIEPTAAQKKAAANSQSYLRRTLEDGPLGDAIEWTALIGSYARRTAIAPIDDVDILVVLDPAHWPTFLWFTRPEPDVVIKDLHRAAKQGYPRSRVRRQSRSVGVRMERLSIDVVPALESDEEDVFYVPDRKAEDWITSAPLAHSEHVQSLNASTRKRFVPLVKLLKYWNSTLPSTCSFKSFQIETLAAHLFADVVPDGIDHGLYLYFDFITHVSGLFGPESDFDWASDCGVSLGVLHRELPDIGGRGDNVLSGAGFARCSGFVKKARIARDRMARIFDRPTEAVVVRELGGLLKASL